MAITGTGTQGNPYVIDTYDDWKAVATGQDTYWTRGNDFWMRLNADIDCTGITWIDLKGTNIPKLHFDLDGHSITGVVVPNTCEYGFFIGMELYNGSISLQGYELYQQLFRYSYSSNTALELHHLNIEISDVTWISQAYGFYYQSPRVFASSNIRYCNITATVHFPDETQYSYGTNTNGYFFAAGGTLEYTDFNLQIYGNYDYYDRNVHAPSRYPLFYNCAIQYCRVREVLHESTVSLTGVLARKTAFAYCVIETDYSEAVIPVDVNYGDATLIYADDASDSNTTIMHVIYPAGETHYTIGTGVTPLTESEIRHYADITAVNFPITRTGETQPTGYRWWITDGTLPYLDSFIPEPTPPTPGGDKAVYRYHADTGWVKEGSIYVRESGAWVAGSGSIIVLDGWSPKDWGERYPRSGKNIWRDGDNLYYTDSVRKYVFNRSTQTWEDKVWYGFPTITGSDGGGSCIWSDGIDIYYSSTSNGNKQYKLDRATDTWSSTSWSGFTKPHGTWIWSDGFNTYYSASSKQYVLDSSTATWIPKTWNGVASFDANRIWKDGDNIYLSMNNTAAGQYVLDRTTSTWVPKIWYGWQPAAGQHVWTTEAYVYYSDISNQYVLDRDTDTWSPKEWSGFTTPSAYWIWTDGFMYYYSSTDTQYFATGHVMPDPTRTMVMHKRLNNNWQDMN